MSAFDGQLIDKNRLIDEFELEEILGKICKIFLDNLPEMLGDIDKAITSGVQDQMVRSSHKLKGSVSNFQVKPLTEKMMELEKLARSGKLAEFKTLYLELIPVYERLTKELRVIATA